MTNSRTANIKCLSKVLGHQKPPELLQHLSILMMVSSVSRAIHPTNNNHNFNYNNKDVSIHTMSDNMLNKQWRQAHAASSICFDMKLILIGYQCFYRSSNRSEIDPTSIVLHCRCCYSCGLAIHLSQNSSKVTH